MQPAQLGPYRIVRPLGKGGMGTVYEGRDANSDLRVAVKVLKPQLAAAEGFRERFEAEIESLKKLRHAAIVRLYGYGEQDGCLYYSMELATGSTLEHQLRSGRRFDWREVTRIGIQLSKALKHAHDHGVIHRDIKPANLLVSDSGEIKLSDFGIARIFGGNQLTAVGGILGTAEYMAPEQAAGQSVDARCDQYSLGCVLYTLLAGRPPFRASGMPELLQLQRFAEPEPVRSFAPATPEELERIIMQLLEKDPARRFRNTLVLAHRLEAMDRALTRATPPGANAAGRAPDQPADAAQMGLEETLDASCAAAALPDIQAEPSVDDETAIPSPAAVAAGPAARRPTAPMDETGRFMTVEQAEQLEQARAREPRSQTIAQGLLLLAALVLLGGLVIYFTRSRSADAIYQQIAAAAAHDNNEALLRVKDAIDEFVRRFPNDPRISTVLAHQEQLRLLRADRRLQGRARRGQGTAALTPVEQMYVAAIRQASSAPEQAVAQLRALLDLYAADRDPGHLNSLRPGPESDRQADSGDHRQSARADVTQRILILARRRLQQLEQRVNQTAQAHRQIIASRLREAQRLRADHLQQARRIWRGIVQIYGEKPWATDLVARAQSQLAATVPHERK